MGQPNDHTARQAHEREERLHRKAGRNPSESEETGGVAVSPTDGGYTVCASIFFHFIDE